MLNEIMTVPAIPYSKETEEAVLGSVIINPECISVVRGIINRPDDFYIVSNKWVWEALCSLDDKKYPIDSLTLSEELGDKVNPSYLTGLVGQSPSSLNAEHYAKQVHLYGVRRRMIQAAGNVAGYAYNEDLEVEDVVARSIEAVQTAANGLLGGRAIDVDKLASDYFDLVERRSQQTNLPGIPTGLIDLDLILGGGLQEGELTIIGGFPGSGKTAFLDTIAYHVSRSRHVALFTLEMNATERINRIFAQETGIDSQRLRSGRLNDEEWVKFTDAIADMESHALKIDDTAPLSMATLRARCVQLRSQGRLDLAIIDYAGLVDGIGKNPYEVASYISRSLKLLSQETNCHVLAAVQFNREGRQGETPKIYNFRDSGSWEQDCNNAYLLYEMDMTVAREFVPRRLEVAKHRNGPTGFVDLLMKKATTKFYGKAKYD